MEVRFLTGLPAWGAVVEGQLSLQLALGGVKGPPVPVDEDDGVVGPPTGDEQESEAPTPADEPPTSDLGSEEE
jgi:hypothetical protein